MIGDAFHSLWCLVPLAALALILLAVAWKRRPYPPSRMGLLLVLIAPAFLLVGGLWNRLGGVKARTELKVGQGSYTLQPVHAGKPYVLPGFQVRLERFDVSRIPSEIRLVATGPGGDLQAGLRTPPLTEGQKGRLGAGLDYEIERLIPGALEFGLKPGRMPVPPASGGADVLLVMLGLGRTEPVLGILHSFGEEAFREEPQGRFAVLFRERLEGSLLASLRPHAPRGERLLATFAGRTQEIPAKAGGRLEVAGAVLKVVKTYPDFQVRKDGAGNPVMSSRSQKPLDPWLEVELLSPGKAPRRVLLSARQPEYTDRLNAPNLPEGLHLKYLREGEETQTRFVVFGLAEHRVALVESGRLVREDTWVLDRPFVVEPGLSVTPLGLFEGFFPAAQGQSETPGRAAVRVRVIDTHSGASERAWICADGSAKALLEGRVALGCSQPLPDPRDLRSTLVVEDPQGRELARKVVGVSDPLVFEGLSFLQGPQGSLDPEASAILVVHRPGAWMVWLGCLILVIGGAWWAYLKLPNRRRKIGTDANVEP